LLLGGIGLLLGDIGLLLGDIGLLLGDIGLLLGDIGLLLGDIGLLLAAVGLLLGGSVRVLSVAIAPRIGVLVVLLRFISTVGLLVIPLVLSATSFGWDSEIFFEGACAWPTIASPAEQVAEKVRRGRILRDAPFGQGGSRWLRGRPEACCLKGGG